jgi:diacylglycerol kinase
MPQKHGLGKSFHFAFKGFKWALQERNFRIHLFISALVTLAGFLLNISPTEWIAVMVCMAIVITLEIINTAIEKTIDLLHPEKHPEAGKIKDLSAAAVLLSALLSVIVGCVVFLPKIWALM